MTATRPWLGLGNRASHMWIVGKDHVGVGVFPVVGVGVFPVVGVGVFPVVWSIGKIRHGALTEQDDKWRYEQGNFSTPM